MEGKDETGKTEGKENQLTLLALRPNQAKVPESFSPQKQMLLEPYWKYGFRLFRKMLLPKIESSQKQNCKWKCDYRLFWFSRLL